MRRRLRREVRRVYLPLSFLLNSWPPLARLFPPFRAQVMVTGHTRKTVTNRARVRAIALRNMWSDWLEAVVIKLYYISGIFIKHRARRGSVFIRVPYNITVAG